MEEREYVDYKKRYRINFKQSTKNQITCDVTFEGKDMERSEALIEATRLLDEAMVIAKERSPYL